MGKIFNITGICRSAKHYMANVSSKLAQTFSMVEIGEYFIINRPRQYGKTTTLYNLSNMLQEKGDYIVLNISFEGVGDSFFNDEKEFSQRFITLLAEYADYRAIELADWLKEIALQIQDLQGLSKVITQMVDRVDKKIVLMIQD